MVRPVEEEFDEHAVFTVLFHPSTKLMVIVPFEFKDPLMTWPRSRAESL
jgi:hypothetical protein